MRDASRRLLIVSRCHEPRGGADRIISDLCRGLPSLGWNVRLAVTVGARFNRPDAFRALYADIPLLELDGCLGTRTARISAIERAIAEHEPDVVLSMRVFDAIEAVARSPLQPRLAYGVRALEAPYIEDVKRFGSGMDLCVTSGRLIARLCAEYGGMPEDRVVSIGGGVEAPRAALPRRQAPHRPLRLLYAGRLESAQKRVLDLPAVLAALDLRGVDCTLDVVGAGPAEDELALALEPWRHAGRARLHGWCSRDELYAVHYPAADVLLHTAAWEGMTIAPREAMVHGVVPVISEFPGALTDGIYVDGETALSFPVGDVDAAAAAIARLAEDPDLYQHLSAGARDSQQGDLGAEGALRAWSTALADCVDGPRRQRRLPAVPDATDGRLRRLGMSSAISDRLRSMLGRPVQHADPGSEWPTASGLLDDEARAEIRLQACDMEAQRVPPGGQA